MDTNIIGNSSQGLTVATDTFIPIYVAGAGTNPSSSAFSNNIMPVAGTLKNFYISCDAGPGAGITRTFWIAKNGTNTGMTVALTGSGTGVSISSGTDLVDTVSFAVGDLLSLHTTATGTTTSTGTTRWCLDANTAANQSMVLATAGNSLSTTATTYVVVSGRGLDAAAGTNAMGVMPTTGTLKNAIMATSGAAGTSASYTATLFQNGSSTAITMTVSGASATTATDTTHTITVAAGDTLYWAVVPSGTVTARGISISMEFDPTINGESIHMFGNSVVTSTSAVRFNAVTSSNIVAYNGTEPARQALTLAAQWEKLYMVLQTAPGGSASYQTQFSLNATAGSPSVTISGANTTGNDTSGTVTSTAGQTIAMKLTPASTPAASVMSWGIVSYIAPASSTPNMGSTLQMMGVG